MYIAYVFDVIFATLYKFMLIGFLLTMIYSFRYNICQYNHKLGLSEQISDNSVVVVAVETASQQFILFIFYLFIFFFFLNFIFKQYCGTPAQNAILYFNHDVLNTASH